eukprot:8552350-Alexandrium_andersonii.AAC.1
MAGAARSGSCAVRALVVASAIRAARSGSPSSPYSRSTHASSSQWGYIAGGEAQRCGRGQELPQAPLSKGAPEDTRATLERA